MTLLKAIESEIKKYVSWINSQNNKISRLKDKLRLEEDMLNTYTMKLVELEKMLKE